MYDIARIDCVLNTEIFNIALKLYHNINIIWDKSGSNKSNFVTALWESSQSLRSQKVKGFSVDGKEIEYSMHFFRDVSFDVNLMSIEGNHLFIIDDIRLYGNIVSKICKVNENAIFLIVLRTEDNSLSKNNFSCFYDAVFSVIYKKIGIKRYLSLRKVVSNLDYIEDYVKLADTCIIEGTKDKSEYTFVRNFYPNVICSNGKKNVVKKILEFKEKNKNKSLVVFIDLCAYGTEFVKYISSTQQYEDVYLIESLSFEYDVYKAMHNGCDFDIQSDCIRGRFFESYFYYLLSKFKFYKCGSISKSHLVKCLHSECDSVCNLPKEVRFKCDFYKFSLQEKLDILLRYSTALSELKDYSGGL